MFRTIAIALMLMTTLTVAEADPGLLFHASFDDTVQAEGVCGAVAPAQIDGPAPEFAAGRFGKALICGHELPTVRFPQVSGLRIGENSSDDLLAIGRIQGELLADPAQALPSERGLTYPGHARRYSSTASGTSTRYSPAPATAGRASSASSRISRSLGRRTP